MKGALTAAQMLRTFGVALVLALAGLIGPPAQAQTYEFQATGRDGVQGYRSSGAGAAVDIDWEAELRLGLLMGHPVVSLQFRYEILGGLVTLPILDGRGEKFETVRFDRLDPESQARVRVGDVKMLFEFALGSERFQIVVDAGAPGRSGEWNFNVPGSPEWDALFEDGIGAPFRADRSKELWRANFTLSSARIERAVLNQYDLHTWYGRTSARGVYAAMDQALDLVEQGVWRSYNLTTPPRPDETILGNPWQASEAFSGRIDPAAWAPLEREMKAWLDRMGEIPAWMRAGDNHRPYARTIEMAQIVFRQLDDQRAGYEGHDTDPDSLPRGYLPAFDPPNAEVSVYGSRATQRAAEERERRERAMSAFERNAFDLIAVIDGTRLTASECDALPSEPSDMRAAFDAYDAKMKGIRACLGQAEDRLAAEAVALRGRLAQLHELVRTAWPDMTEDERRRWRAEFERLEQQVSSRIAAARQGLRDRRSAWNDAVRDRNEAATRFMDRRAEERARARDRAAEQARKRARLERLRRAEAANRAAINAFGPRYGTIEDVYRKNALGLNGTSTDKCAEAYFKRVAGCTFEYPTFEPTTPGEGTSLPPRRQPGSARPPASPAGAVQQ